MVLQLPLMTCLHRPLFGATNHVCRIWLVVRPHQDDTADVQVVRRPLHGGGDLPKPVVIPQSPLVLARTTTHVRTWGHLRGTTAVQANMKKMETENGYGLDTKPWTLRGRAKRIGRVMDASNSETGMARPREPGRVRINNSAGPSRVIDYNRPGPQPGYSL